VDVQGSGAPRAAARLGERPVSEDADDLSPLRSAARILYAQGHLAESDAVSDAAARLAVFDASLAPGGGLPEMVTAAILAQCPDPRICSVRGGVTRGLRCGPCEHKALHALLAGRDR
jgi:hypothetical protein